jgi:hypothetical protein
MDKYNAYIQGEDSITSTHGPMKDSSEHSNKTSGPGKLGIPYKDAKP